MKAKQPTLNIFCGLPGSGKTRMAKQIEKEIGAVRLCSDDWMADLGIDFFDELTREKLQNRLYALALFLLSKNVDVILEDGHWTVDSRKEQYDHARDCGARIAMHIFNLTTAEQWRRIEHRNQNLTHGAVPLTRELLDSYIELFVLPTQEEVAKYDEVHWYEDTTPLIYKK